MTTPGCLSLRMSSAAVLGSMTSWRKNSPVVRSRMTEPHAQTV